MQSIVLGAGGRGTERHKGELSSLTSLEKACCSEGGQTQEPPITQLQESEQGK